MAWIEGTATDYRDMLDQLVEVVTSDHVDTIAVVSGGTGFAVDDIITITDGTKTHSATARVLTLSGSAIATIQIEQGGAYTADPTLSATTAWTVAPSGGSGATFDLTMTNAADVWTVERRAQEAVNATVATGGTGYIVGEKVTLTMDGSGVLGATGEGTQYGVAPVFEVATLSGSAIATLTLDTAGHIEVAPDVDGGTGGFQANTTSDGSGTGAVLTVTYQDVGATQEDLVVLNAPGTTGSEDIRMAIRTHQESDLSGFDTAYNWQLFGLVQWSNGLAVHEQSGISPGMESDIGDRTVNNGAYMVLENSSFDFWMSVNNRRVILVAKPAAGVYSSMYLGFINPFATTSEQPYPLYVSGCTTRKEAYPGDTNLGRISGISELYASNWSASTSLGGPAYYRAADNEWSAFRNATVSGDYSPGFTPTRSATSDFTIWPTGRQTYTFGTTQDRTTFTANADGVDFAAFYPSTGTPGTPTYKLRPTPNTGDDVRPLIPLTLMATDDSSPEVYYPIGELDNCYWISNSDATTDLASEDVQKDGDVRYIVFHNGNQSQSFSFFALKQE